VRVEAGFDAEGRVLALDMRVRTNTGAYGAHALTVASNCGSKVLPLYPTEHVSFAADSVYTNLPVAGAYRGYGATQAAFATECVMDEAAEQLGLDPVVLRQKNHIREGGTSPVFRMLGEGTEGVEQVVESCGLAECIERGAEAIGWTARRDDTRECGSLRRGYGMAIGMQGSSIPQIDMGAASIKMNEDGSFNLLIGATDLGTGSDTVLAQVAAEVLGVPLDKIIVYSSDTDMTPFDVGAYASSTTYLSGRAVEKAALDVAGQIRAVAGVMLEARAGELMLSGEQAVAPSGRAVSLSEVAERSLYGVDQHQIAAFASHITEKSPPPFAAHFVKIDVDRETGFVHVRQYVMAVDCGTAINPKLAEGQCEGAVLNGLSYALTEQYLFDENGRMRNPSFRDYKIFSTADRPELVTILVPTYEPTGPYGAKSVSEIGINGALPALANAIYDAVGVRLRSAPFLPERILAALDARQ
jgi:CO/xanthine dehydrogenase Mo-binding subunit